MNQSILFNDDAIWLESEQSVRFSAQALGSLIQCHISRHRLESLAGDALPRPADLLGAFASAWRSHNDDDPSHLPFLNPTEL